MGVLEKLISSSFFHFHGYSKASAKCANLSVSADTIVISNIVSQRMIGNW